MDKRVDAYISKSADFAKPVLNHFRRLVHRACPQVEETIKWGFPHFDYKGMMCSMASFKNHCAFGFWKAALMKDAGIFKKNNEDAMGHAGKIKSVEDLPADEIIIGQVKEAMKLNDEGIKFPDRTRKKPKIIVPASLKKGLIKNGKASATFNNFSPTHKKEYIDWINEARTEETQNKRVFIAIGWLAEGKIRNWKYVKK